MIRCCGAGTAAPLGNRSAAFQLFGRYMTESCKFDSAKVGGKACLLVQKSAAAKCLQDCAKCNLRAILVVLGSCTVDGKSASANVESKCRKKHQIGSPYRASLFNQ